jgi:hypothetical protein
MKKLIIGALLVAQLQLAAQPAFATQQESVGDQRTGAFGGLRVRLPFGGVATDRRLRAGLALAPMLQDRFASGETRLRIGEGMEFGIRGREPLRLSIGGRDVRQLAAQGNGRGGGVPTGLWIAGGLVLVTVALVGAAALALEDADDD